MKKKYYIFGCLFGGILGFIAHAFSKSMCYYSRQREVCHQEYSTSNLVLNVILGIITGIVFLFLSNKIIKLIKH